MDKVRYFFWRKITVSNWVQAVFAVGVLYLIVDTLLESPYISAFLVVLITALFAPELRIWLSSWEEPTSLIPGIDGDFVRVTRKQRLRAAWDARREYYYWQLTLFAVLILLALTG